MNIYDIKKNTIMKKLKYVKLFESFVNEELTQGTKLSQALILHMGKQPKEKGPEMDKWEEDRKVYEKALKDHLKQYDVDVSFYISTSNTISLWMDFPESFMSNVKRFFGFGKSKIQLNYHVENLIHVNDTSPGENLKEYVAIGIGIDRTNSPDISGKYDDDNKYVTSTDISKVDSSRKGNELIDLDKEDAQMMCKLLQDINPFTKFNTPQILVEALNEQLEGSHKQDVEKSQTDPAYKFVVLNRIVLR